MGLEGKGSSLQSSDVPNPDGHNHTVENL